MDKESEVRLSGPALKVLGYLLSDIGHGKSGADISKAAKVAPGTLYPLLIRLERAGWLKGEWEAGDPRELGRPRRRYYCLTGVGQKNARSRFDELQFGGDFVWNT